MKRLFLIILLGLSTQLFAQSKAQKEILKVLESQRTAWNKGDMAGYMAGYFKDEALLFVGRSGPEYGWETTLANYKKAYPDKAAMGELLFDIKEIRLLDKKQAFVLGAWHLNGEKGEKKGWFTLLMQKIKGEWKVVADHSS